MPLDGELTRLRAVELTDVDRFYCWVNDLDVTEHLAIVYPMSMAAEQAWAEQAIRRNSYGHLTFAVDVIETGEHVGNCGLHDVHPVDRVAELGVMIGAKDHWGKGYAFDALGMLLAFAFRSMNLRRVMLRADANHARAIALYERLGFRDEGVQRGAHWSRGRALDFRVMGIMRDEFDHQYGATEEVGDVPRR